MCRMSGASLAPRMLQVVADLKVPLDVGPGGHADPLRRSQVDVSVRTLYPTLERGLCITPVSKIQKTAVWQVHKLSRSVLVPPANPLLINAS